MKHYDLIIVGSGAGLSILEVALQHGLKCALVEKDSLGGTCLNRGCIPSKVLVYPADIIREAAHAKKIGVSLGQPEIDWPKISRRMWSYISHSQSIEDSINGIDQVTLYRGTATFIGRYSMQVLDEKNRNMEPFTGKQIIIAAGARTFVPQIEGLAETGYVTSETFFGPKFPTALWKKLVIVGGGAIGLEFAHIFSALGTEVTIVEMADHLAPTEEPAISTMLEEVYSQLGIRVLTSHVAVKASLTDGGKRLQVQNTSTKESRTIDCDEVFIAAGVRSNADLLRSDRADLKTDERGYIVTNPYLETNQSHIFALGDINGRFQFRHKANYEAEILVHNMFGHSPEKRAAKYNAVPWAIFTYPQIAHVGMREDEIRAKGIRYQVAINDFASIAKGYAMGYGENDLDNGFVKLLVDENMKILGVHIIGPHAAILIQPFVYLMNAGISCNERLTEQIRSLQKKGRTIPGLFPVCPDAGTFDPIRNSMVIHPALSELTAWAIEDLDWGRP